MQELARLQEFFAHFSQNTLLCPGMTPPPPLGFLILLMEDLQSLGLRLAEYPPPPPKEEIGTSHGGLTKFEFEADRIPTSPSSHWNFSWRT